MDWLAQRKVCAFYLGATGSILAIPEINSLNTFPTLSKFIDSAAQNIGQWRINVDQTHLELLDMKK